MVLAAGAALRRSWGAIARAFSCRDVQGLACELLDMALSQAQGRRVSQRIPDPAGVMHDGLTETGTGAGAHIAQIPNGLRRSKARFTVRGPGLSGPENECGRDAGG